MALLQVPLVHLIANKISGHKNANRNRVSQDKNFKEILAVSVQHLEKVVAVMKGDALPDVEEIKPKNLENWDATCDPKTIEKKINDVLRYIFFCLYILSVLVHVVGLGIKH